MTTVFEPGKTYKTGDGRDALIYCVDAPGKYPIHGRVHVFIQSWNLAGKMCAGCDCPVDLMPPEPERIDRTVWVNAYSIGDNHICFTAEAAKNCATNHVTRIAVPCRLVEIVGDAPIDGDRHRV